MDTSAFTKNGRFLLIALDHRGSFRKILNPTKPEAVTDAEILSVKKELISAMTTDATGYLIDVEHREAGKESEKPAIMPLEKTGYENVEGERLTQLSYSVGQLKTFGASAAKLLLYFNPNLPHKEKQLETAKKAVEDAHSVGLPLFLELLTYTNESDNFSPDFLISSLNMLIDHKIVPDVWKLPFPETAEGCKMVTQVVGKTPWILLTHADYYDVFKKELETACLNGAVGFLAGRALWQEIQGMNSEERSHFIQTTVAQRFHEICTITSRLTSLV